MDYILKPTLLHMCLTKIVAELWTQDDFSALEVRLSWVIGLERKALERAQSLPLPNQLKKELSELIQPIGLSMYQWFLHLYKHYNILRNNPVELSWTSNGIIDARKSVKILVLDQSLQVGTRYKLACNFCLVDSIFALWKQMSPKEQLDCKLIYSHSILPDPIDLVQFWSYYITDDLNKLIEIIRRHETIAVNTLSLYQYLFKFAMQKHNTVAAKYFYEKLSSKEKTQWAFSFVENPLALIATFFNYNDHGPEDFCSDLLCFFLSKMNKNQQMEELKKSVKCVLHRLLLWNYQSIFLETVNRMWEFISKEDFRSLLFDICWKIEPGSKRCSSEYIFRRFWQSSNLTSRKYVINHRDCMRFMLGIFFHDGGEEMCKLILNDANALEKERFLYENVTEGHFRYRIREKSCSFLKFLIVECGSSERKINELSKLFNNPDLNLNNDEKRDLFQFLDRLPLASK